MHNSTSSAAGWRFSLKVMLPVILAVLVTVITVAGFVTWSTSRNDERALVRQTRLVAHILAEQARTMPEDMSDVAVWDDLITAIDRRDQVWIDDNISLTAFDIYGHNRLYLLDAAGKPVYAMHDGGRVDPKAFGQNQGLIAPMVERLRTIDGQASISAYNNGASDGIPHVTDVAVVENRPAIVSVVPVLSDTGELAAEPGREPMMASVMFLDDALASYLMGQYLIEGAHFGLDADLSANEAAYPIANAAGQPIAWFKWLPDRPGAQIIADTLPAMIGAFLVAGLIITLLLRGLLRSTSALEAGRAEAQHRALHDPLTGIANRALFTDRLSAALNQMPRGEPRMALLALDLDRFKQVNDTLGHDAGDELLRQVAARISPLLGPKDTIARLGGDEFAVIQPEIGRIEEATLLADRIVQSLRTPFLLSGHKAEIGVSIGIATAPDLAQSPAELTARADAALYQAKGAGRSQYQVYHPEMARTVRRETMEADLRDALGRPAQMPNVA
jgi:diguanylate cyclase (GGDEF)-like protein